MPSIFAILLYILWWHKPLSPEEPIVLKGDWVNPLCAYMYMSSEMSALFKPSPMDLVRMIGKFFASFDSRILCNWSEMDYMVYCESGNLNSMDGGLHLARTRFRPATEESLPRMLFRKPEEALEFKNLFQSTKDAPSLNASEQIRINRWNLATMAVEEYPAIRMHYQRRAKSHGCRYFESEELIMPKAVNCDLRSLLLGLNQADLQTALWLPSCLYGVLHLVAWKWHFPSIAEKWLWRSSSMYICCCAGLWLVMCYGLYLEAQIGRPGRKIYEKLRGVKSRWLRLVMDILGSLCSLSWQLAIALFILARCFIAVEAGISIRNLPAKAYDTPSWIQVLPHV